MSDHSEEIPPVEKAPPPTPAANAKPPPPSSQSVDQSVDEKQPAKSTSESQLEKLPTEGGSAKVDADASPRSAPSQEQAAGESASSVNVAQNEVGYLKEPTHEPYIASKSEGCHDAVLSPRSVKEEHDVVASSASQGIEASEEKSSVEAAVGSPSEVESTREYDMQTPSEGSLNKNDAGGYAMEPDRNSTSSSSNIILSLTDPYYHDTMLSHYQILGKARDPEKESDFADRLFNLFKSKLGESGNFYKRDRDYDMKVNDETAYQSKFPPD